MASIEDPKGSVREICSTEDDNVGVPKAKYKWYRGVFFNATIVGVAAFAAPGLWNAMQSVGAGGEETPYLVMAGNAILFALMTLTCLAGSTAANRFGLRASLVFGTTGYVLYSAALYANNRYGTVWFVYAGAAACGLSAGVFWAAEGAIVLTYPAPATRGRYLAYWLAYRNGGSILGGSVNLAFNYGGETTGRLDWRTYIVFVVLQCLGPAMALFLSPPDKVQRRDGTRVQTAKRVSDVEEIKELLRVMKRKEFLLVLPYFIFVAWELPYNSSYLSLYFSVRARALASLVAAVAQITTTLAFGAFLDWPRLHLNRRARYAYIFMMALAGGCWVWGIVVQAGYSAASSSSAADETPSLDWSDDGFGRGWALYILWSVNFSLAYNYGFWLVGLLARDAKEVVRYVSVARAAEAAGQCVASGISSTSAPLIAAAGVNFALWGLVVVPAYFVVRQVGIVHWGPEQAGLSRSA